jgi:hypothetical protein
MKATTLSDRIADFLKLQSSTEEFEERHGSRRDITIKKYFFQNQWQTNLTDERTGAVRECYRKLNITYWPVDYNEAVEYLEDYLRNL